MPRWWSDSTAVAATRRGVTLLELLIVIALLLAMAAAVGPTVLNTLDERTFESATDVTGRQMMLARAHAQASGQPVEVVYLADADEPRIVARAFAVEESEQPIPLTPSWAHRVLPRGYSMTDQPPQPADAWAAGSAGIPAASSEWDDPALAGTSAIAETVTLQLGVFLPDGSAMSSQPRWLSDGDGRTARLRLNLYTGEVAFERLGPESLQNAASDLADDDAMRWDEP